jgi:hypothetical protein
MAAALSLCGGRRCRLPAAAAAGAAATALLYAAVLACTLLPSARACIDPYTHDYQKFDYYNADDGHTYTLHSIYTASGCLNDFFTAKAICVRQGLELAPEGEATSIGEQPAGVYWPS